MAAYCYVRRKLNGWTVNYEQEMGEARQLARRAVDLGQDDAVALTFGGYTLAHAVGDVEGAAVFIDRALTLNPNLVAAWHYSGLTKIWLGEPECDCARSLMRGARYDEPCMWSEKSLQGGPNTASGYRIAAASNALVGRIEKAQKIPRAFVNSILDSAFPV